MPGKLGAYYAALVIRADSPMFMVLYMEQARPAPSDNVGYFDGAEAPRPEGAATSFVDRALFEEFMRTRDKCRGALVALNGRLMIMNASAGELLNPAERPRLWKVGKDAIAQGSPQIRELCLGHGKSVMASHRPVVRDGTAIGVIVQFSVPDNSPAPLAVGEGVSRPPAGWADLTRTERQVAQVVATGLTNREAGRRVFMSPHTVDAHLRHIFRKLDINSRVELARIVGEQEAAARRQDTEERGGTGVQWSLLG
jgi:DNA-binding CsgD family transcriptional regulator